MRLDFYGRKNNTRWSGNKRTNVNSLHVLKSIAVIHVDSSLELGIINTGI